MALVFIKRSDGTKNKYRLPEKEGLAISIGRNSDCIISLPDVVGISGMHCAVIFRNGSFYIKDEGSTNGTLRQGVNVTAEEPLQESTEYSIGDAILTYQADGVVVPPLPQAAPAPAPAAAPLPAAPAAPAAAPLPEGAPDRPKRPARKSKLGALGRRPGYVPQKSDGIAPFFAVAIVIVSFVAGMTLRHWKDTGGFFPSELLSSKPAPPAAAPAAPASKPATQPSAPAATSEPAEPQPAGPEKTALGTPAV